MSFGMINTSLGCINVLSVPLPHNGASLKARISQAEKFLAHSVKLFKDNNGENTLNDNDIIDFLSDTFPGVVADDPIVIIYKQQKSKPATEPEPHGFSK